MWCVTCVASIMLDAGSKGSMTGKYQQTLPAAVLLAGLVLTAFVLNTVYRDIQRNRMDEFARRSDELSSRISDALETQQYLLMGVRSLYEGAGYVGRDEFQGYLESIDMVESFPEIYAVGWVPRVPHHIVHEFMRSVRDDRSINEEGFPDFKLKPDHYVAEHHVLTYLYPLEHNRWMLGFDLSANAERLLTLEHARDSGQFAISPPLAMTMDPPTVMGFLLMLPSYGEIEPENLAQRRQFYRGMLIGIFRYEKLLEPFRLDDFTAVDIRDITDVNESEKALSITPFYSVGEAPVGVRTLHRNIRVANREWQLTLSLGPRAHAQLKSSALLWVTAFCALGITLAGALGTARLAASRDRALRQSEALSKDLLQANKSLRLVDDELRQFASVTSHDLQVPVSNVDLSVTLLENALTSRMTPPVRENLDQLRESSSRLHKLTEDLQNFSRVDRDTLKLDVVDLDQLFGLVQARLAPLIDEVEAVIDIGKLPQINGDREQLRQLVGNLLSNAIKYRSPARKLAVRVDARLVDDYWQISVADNGIGIEERFHDKVFKPFQRLHQHEDIVGTGLGLRICQQIVECHEGQIHIAASSDAGTTFMISLPAGDRFDQKAA